MKNQSKRTVMQALDAMAAKQRSAPALSVKESGTWQTTTWTEYRDKVRLAVDLVRDPSLPFIDAPEPGAPLMLGVGSAVLMLSSLRRTKRARRA